MKAVRHRSGVVCRSVDSPTSPVRNTAIVNVELLNRFEDGAEITPELLKQAGLVRKELDGVKILGVGELEKKLTVKANKFSKSAVEAIEKAGGKVEVI